MLGEYSFKYVSFTFLLELLSIFSLFLFEQSFAIFASLAPLWATAQGLGSFGPVKYERGKLSLICPKAITASSS